jgi:hypothetical protein
VARVKAVLGSSKYKSVEAPSGAHTEDIEEAEFDEEWDLNAVDNFL